ncbi:unnamed protein product [Peronospora belbahrii]|uniref:Uncharacterized protein n=1 Tax=Peronospora belbahrii TaxID=622444 RepID=A0AAU9KRY1_9STRA|nr:unnamed protein product [Peronospora belbahrii]CAH0516140.1 unnamed protein product [Peronospora belbahrii]
MLDTNGIHCKLCWLTDNGLDATIGLAGTRQKMLRFANLHQLPSFHSPRKLHSNSKMIMAKSSRTLGFPLRDLTVTTRSCIYWPEACHEHRL